MENNISIYTFLEREVKRLKIIKKHHDNMLFADLSFYNEQEISLKMKLKELKTDYHKEFKSPESILHNNIQKFFNESFGLKE